MSVPDTGTAVGTLKFRNPLLLASGILGESAASMVRVYNSGAAGVVTKSIGSESRPGYRNPTVFEFGSGMLNAMGLPNPGIVDFGEVVRKTRASGVPTIASIFGSSPAEFAALAASMQEYGADAVELNLSCPHVERFGAEIGSTPAMVGEVVKTVRDSVSLPIWAKMTPNVADVAALAGAAEDAGADAIVAINTVKGMAISAKLRMPVLSHSVGGMSGRAVKYVGLRSVYEISGRCGLPVVGVGGISCGEDVAEYLMAGASAVQVGTAVSEGGPGVFGRIAGELSSFMSSEGFSSIREMVGIARR